MTGGHFIIYCSECKKVLAQCRCPSKDKEVRYAVCDECNKKTGQQETEIIKGIDWWNDFGSTFED